MKASKTRNCNIDNHVAQMVCEMAKRFYSDPENVKKYEAWHLQEYGCLPDDYIQKKKRKGA